MKAVVNTGAGGPEVLEIQQRQDPVPGLHQVRVRVRASALNRADISQRLGRYPAPLGSPQDIPGLEYSGEVDEIGAGTTMWKAGDRVMGIVGGGAHAELLCTHEREVMSIPARLSFEEAAGVPEVFLTAYDALFTQLGMSGGETLLIHAAGSGVGTAAIQLAKVAGLRTIGTSRSPQKLDRAKQLGLDQGIVAVESEWPRAVLSATNDTGVDAILDLVGASYLQGNLEVLAPRGRLVSVGLTGGASSVLDMRLLMRKRLSIIGTVLRSRPIEERIPLVRAFAHRMLPLFDNQTLAPVVDHVFPFEEIRAAHELVESNNTFGKVILAWS
jgi:putative PIG3 family NAD(P)H quinone oxidoreductase